MKYNWETAPESLFKEPKKDQVPNPNRPPAHSPFRQAVGTCVHAPVVQLCDPRDYSLPGSPCP